MSYDAIIVGAGFAGAVAARELAERGDKRVLVLEKRGHIGGNAYDCLDDHGVLIHRYGPHIFHTCDKRVYDYLSRFTDWLDYQHRVVANVHGTLMPVPFNLTSLELAFAPNIVRALEDKLLHVYGSGTRVTILELRAASDPDLHALADYVYENIFKYYTMKQWGTTPENIDPATTARVPVLLSHDDRYFQDPWQGIPAGGYTAIFDNLLSHPNIEVRLNVAAQDLLDVAGDEVTFEGKPFEGEVIYTGAADELYGCVYGRLPYRTLDFKFETLPVEFFQTRGTVNYTVSEDYTRITEFKHMTGQHLPDRTTIVKEYSRAYTGAVDETPYYAIISPENSELYEKYRQLSARHKNLHLLGRLAEYKYYNMDAIVARALDLSGTLLH